MRNYNRSWLLSSIAVCTAACLSAGDASFDIFYTQYSFEAPAALNKAHVVYTFSNDSITVSANTTLYSAAVSDPAFGADGITVDPNTNNLLIAGGGSAGAPGMVYQLTQTGARGTPYSVSPDTSNPAAGPRAYTVTVVPPNAQNGFLPNTLLGLEKDFGYGRISVMPLSPALGNGIAYPVTGDDVSVTGIAFSANGTPYYGSGTEESGAGNFGIIYYDGTKFITHRLFGQPIGNDPRGGIIFAGTHRLTYDSFTGHIFTAGASSVGQYDPSTNVFHTLTISGVSDGFQFSTPVTDGQGHVLLTACCGLPGDPQNGAGDIVIVDYSNAPGHLIDAASNVQFQHAFLATNIGAAVIGSGPVPPPGPPLIAKPPQNTSAIVGQTATFSVSAIGPGLTFQWQSKPSGAPGFSPISGATASTYTTPSVTAANNGTQYLCMVTNPQGSVPSSAATLTVLPASTSFVTSTSVGTVRGNYSGWVGMIISVGSQPIAITALGRLYTTGNTGSHAMKIVTAAGADVAGSSAIVAMYGGTFGNFVYANLSAPVSLNGNTTYYVLSQETAGGDSWYDYNTSAQTTPGVSLDGAAYGPPFTTIPGTAGHMYGPLDFKYAVTINVTVSPSSVTLSNSGSQTFTAAVTGTLNTGVTWSISPGVGSITSGGVYTAPVNISNGQPPVTVTATSSADSSKLGTAMVNLVPPSAPGITQQPQNATAAAGQTATFTVGATGGSLSYQWESKPAGGVSFSAIGGANGSSYQTPPVSASDNGTQFHCVVSNGQGNAISNAALLTVSSDTAFVISSAAGTARNNFTGTVGMVINVGNTPLSVTALGRMVLSGNTGSHTVKIVDAVSGADVPGATAAVNTVGGTAGAFAYAGLSGVVLNANATYYILSQETLGGDQWYDLNTTLQNRTVASIAGAVYGSGGSYIPVGNSAGHSYVPVDFRYTLSATGPTSILTSSFIAGTARNNFSGWVGASITTGASSFSVTHLGRLFLSGNSGTHTVKIVNASTGADVPGASVSVNLSGGIAGTFDYAALPSSVALAPNTVYYIVSQEVQGGDQWYDYNTTVQTSSAATVNGGVYSFDGVSYIPIVAAGHMYVPVDLKYTIP